MVEQEQFEAWLNSHEIIDPMVQLGPCCFVGAKFNGQKRIIKFLEQLDSEHDCIAQKKFFDEICFFTLATEAHHKSFVAVLESISTDRHNLVLDYFRMDQDIVDRWIERTGTFKFRTTIKFGFVVCEILEFMHGKMMVCGNVSPHSFILDDSGVRIFDLFHIERVGSQSSPKWLTDYAAPEQHHGETTEQSDLYGLGLLLLRLFTGLKPLERHKINWSEIGSQSKNLEDLLRELIEPDPTKRPATAKRTRIRLREILRAREPEALVAWDSRYEQRLERYRHRLTDEKVTEFFELTLFEQRALLSQLGNLDSDLGQICKWLRVGPLEEAAIKAIWRGQELLREGQYKDIFGLLKPFAESGSAWAQNNLGVLYEMGNGVEQSYHNAFHWYTKAAEQDLATAFENLAIFYAEGFGVVTPDEAKALECFARSVGDFDPIDDMNSFKIGVTYDWTWDPKFPTRGEKEFRTMRH